MHGIHAIYKCCHLQIRTVLKIFAVSFFVNIFFTVFTNRNEVTGCLYMQTLFPSF
jgi:hypothetical protein